MTPEDQARLPEFLAAATKGPWSQTMPRSSWITAPHYFAKDDLFHIADVRGWGDLTGKEHGGMGLSDSDATAIQTANAALIALAPSLAATVIALTATVEALRSAQTYRYIGRDGKSVLARDLEDRVDDLRAQLAASVEANRALVADNLRLAGALAETEALEMQHGAVIARLEAPSVAQAAMVLLVARAILKARFYDCEPEAYESLDAFYVSIWDDWGDDALYEAESAIRAIAQENQP